MPNFRFCVFMFKGVAYGTISDWFGADAQEPGERCDFLPEFVGRLYKRGARVLLEYG
ncbi:MAG: hypothetical protein OHK0052_10210 [Anaerolineales bacterium]